MEGPHPPFPSINGEGTTSENVPPSCKTNPLSAGDGRQRTKKTIISAVIDRSGSMKAIWNKTVTGFSSFLKSQKEVDGHALYSLRVFDDQHTLVYSFASREEACALPDTIKPRRSTALNDAIGQEIDRIKCFQIEKPSYSNVVLLIMTDGKENSSKEYTSPEVKTLVRDCEEKGWQIIFMGANIDAFATGRTLGVSNNIQYDSLSVHASYVTASESASSYRQSGKKTVQNVDLTKR